MMAQGKVGKGKQVVYLYIILEWAIEVSYKTSFGKYKLYFPMASLAQPA